MKGMVGKATVISLCTFVGGVNALYCVFGVLSNAQRSIEEADVDERIYS